MVRKKDFDALLATVATNTVDIKVLRKELKVLNDKDAVNITKINRLEKKIRDRIA